MGRNRKCGEKDSEHDPLDVLIYRYLSVRIDGATWADLQKNVRGKKIVDSVLKHALDKLVAGDQIERHFEIQGDRAKKIYTVKRRHTTTETFEEDMAFSIWLQSRIDKSGRPSPGLAEDLSFAARWIAADVLYQIRVSVEKGDTAVRDKYLKMMCGTYLYTLISQIAEMTALAPDNPKEAIDRAASDFDVSDLVARALYEAMPTGRFKDLNDGAARGGRQ